MNISTIAAMIAADPTIANNIQAFVDSMNALTQTRTVQQPVVVQQAVTEATSIAEMNGGACTPADVNAAIALVNARPYVDQTVAIFNQVVAALESMDKAAIGDALNAATAAIQQTKTALGIA